MSTRSGITRELTLGCGPEGRQTGEMAFQAGRQCAQAYEGMRLHGTSENASRWGSLGHKKQGLRGKQREGVANMRTPSSQYKYHEVKRKLREVFKRSTGYLHFLLFPLDWLAFLPAS